MGTVEFFPVVAADVRQERLILHALYSNAIHWLPPHVIPSYSRVFSYVSCSPCHFRHYLSIGYYILLGFSSNVFKLIQNVHLTWSSIARCWYKSYWMMCFYSLIPITNSFEQENDTDQWLFIMLCVCLQSKVSIPCCDERISNSYNVERGLYSSVMFGENGNQRIIFCWYTYASPETVDMNIINGRETRRSRVSPMKGFHLTAIVLSNVLELWIQCLCVMDIMSISVHLEWTVLIRWYFVITSNHSAFNVRPLLLIISLDFWFCSCFYWYIWTRYWKTTPVIAQNISFLGRLQKKGNFLLLVFRVSSVYVKSLKFFIVNV